MRHVLALFAVLGGALLCAGSAGAESLQCTSITSVPFTISASGSYCLTGNLTSTVTGTAAAITIAANNVELDLNRHVLAGPGGTTAGFGIYAIARSGLRIRNGTLRGFTRGVFVTDSLVGLPPITPSGASNQHEISELRVEGGIFGISLLGHFSSVHNNQIVGATQYGIAAGGTGGGVEVRENFVSNVSAGSLAAYAISVGAPGSVVQSNVVSGVRGSASSAAIYVGGSSSIVSRNRETDLAGAYAVYCSGGGVKVEGNIFAGTVAASPLFGCSTLGTNG
ncbi:MAG: hypothetical protein ABI411_07950 [Tahibacter sp.]